MTETAGPLFTAGETEVQIGASQGLHSWLVANRVSFAFSSYQSGRLFLVGALPDGNVSVHQQRYSRAMGLAFDGCSLHLAARAEMWRLEGLPTNSSGPFDVRFVPRQASFTGDIDVHELGIDRSGRVIFVNTLYSCLATLDRSRSFRPLWKPAFISALAPEDRCHLNGVGFEDGVPRYVTAVAISDTADGWHGRPLPLGVVIDVEMDRVVTDRLSMPHSPRVHGGRLYALDSGRGFLVAVDRDTGSVEDIAFCPGFLRGLSIHGRFALVTVSKPRYGGFDGLPIEAELKLRHGTPMCAVLVIDLHSGEIAEWLKLEGGVEELFSVEILPGIACPFSVGAYSLEHAQDVTFEDNFVVPCALLETVHS